MEPTTTTMLAVIMAAMVSPEKSTRLYGTPRFLEKSLAQSHNVEMVGEEEGQHHQRHRQPDDLIPAFQHQREWPTSQEDRAWVISYLYAR